jgi:hypothetical protein
MCDVSNRILFKHPLTLLDALGALTKGQRQTGGQGLFDPKENLES